MIKHKEKPNSKEELEDLLNPIVKKWFFSKFKEFSLPQLFCVMEVHSRNNILLSAPTGGTKTLSSMLSILNELIDCSEKGILQDKIYAVYVSPLKALNRDISLNLIEPLEQMEKVSGKKLGIRIGLRTGDTTANEKQKMLKNPPHILVTTPESLSILLSSTKFSEHLKNVEWAIVDEIHSIAENKRGVHLSLILEQLQNLSPSMCRVGLSATVAPLENMAQYLVGTDRDCKIVDVQYIKKNDLEVISPVEDLVNTSYETINKETLRVLDELIQTHKTTLIFTNTRAATERVVHNLKTVFPHKYKAIDDDTKEERDLIGAHHGSLSKEHRVNLENNLREGKLKAVVCLDGNTKILTSTGEWVRIKDIYYEQVQSLNPELKLNNNLIISRVLKENEDSLIKLKTSCGKEIISTKEHKFLTINSYGLTEWKEAKDINEKDFIATIRSYSYQRFSKEELDIFTFDNYSDNGFVIIEPKLNQEIRNKIINKYGSLNKYWELYIKGCSYSQFRAYFKKNLFKVSILKNLTKNLNLDKQLIFENIKLISSDKSLTPKITFSSDFMRLLGFMMAEGYISDIGFFVSNRNPKVLEYYSKLLEKVSGKKPFFKLSSTGTPIYVWYSVFLSNFLNNLGFIKGRKSRISKLPPFFYRLDSDLIFSFLSGYFDGDGYVENKTKQDRVYSAGIVTTSKKMVNDLSLILIREGILNSIRSKYIDSIQLLKDGREIIKKGWFYEVSVLGGENLRNFARKMSPVRENISKIKSTLDLNGYCNLDVIPNLGIKIKELRQKNNISNYNLAKNNKTDLSKYELGNRNISRNKLKEVYSYFESKEKYILDLANSDIFWDKINSKEIVKPTSYVYNIEVENDHNYIANGFITKNCSTSLELGIDIGSVDLVICLGSPKSVARFLQRCLPYESKVLLANGTYKEIGEIVEKKLSVEILSYDSKKGFIKNKIIKFHKNKSNSLIYISLHSGLEIKCTEEHPIMTQEGWKKAGEISVNDKIAELFEWCPEDYPYIYELINKKEFYVENRDNFLRKVVDAQVSRMKCSYGNIAKLIGIKRNHLQDYIRKTGKIKSIRLDIFLAAMFICNVSKEIYLPYLKEIKSKANHKVPIDLKLDKDFMWLAGMVASDGALTKTKNPQEIMIKLGNKDKSLLEHCQKIFNKYGFFPQIRVDSQGFYSLDCGSKLLVRILNSLGIKIGKGKSFNIEVSKNLYKFPKELIISYIEGVLEGDGNVDNGIRIFSGSKNFIIGLHNLLNRCGIKNYFVTAEAKISKLIPKINSDKIYCLYISKNQFIHKFLENCTLFGKKTQRLLKTSKRSKLEKDIEDNICWTSIKKIENIENSNYVYNITLEKEPNNYFVDSILTHNCGRSNHQLDGVTKGILLVNERDDLVECSVLLKYAIEKKIDRIHIPTNCLDVLSQQIMGLALEQVWDYKQLYDLIKKSYCYKYLTKKDFDEVLDYLAGNFISLEERHIYARIWWDKEENKIGKKGKMSRIIYMTNLGTIPDQQGVIVKDNQGNKIGMIDEAFLEKLGKGDIFVLGGNTYQFCYARGMVAQVIPMPNKKPTVPSWFSDRLPLSYDLAKGICIFRSLMASKFKKNESKKEILKFINEYLYVSDIAAEALYNYFKDQYDYIGIPDDKKLIVECYRDEQMKNYVVFHALYGRRVNDALSRALALAIARSQHKDVEIGISDNGFYVSYDRNVDVVKSFGLLKTKEFRKVLDLAVDKSEILKRRFRHCAGRSFMILRSYKGVQKRVGRQQVSSTILLNAVRRISENFFIIRETRREILEDLMDFDSALEVLQEIEDGKIKLVEVQTFIPSPFALNLIMQGYSDILKLEDKQQFLQRMHQMVKAKIALKKRWL